MEDGRIWRKILACDRYVAAVARSEAGRAFAGRAAPLSLLLPACPSIRRPSVRPHAIEGGKIAWRGLPNRRDCMRRGDG